MKDGIMFLGDYRPVNVMRNGIQIAGYTEQEVSGTDVVVEHTYNDNLSPTIKGNTELKSAWSQSAATSSQAQTIQGKNLFDVSKYPALTLFQVNGNSGTLNSGGGGRSHYMDISAYAGKTIVISHSGNRQQVAFLNSIPEANSPVYELSTLVYSGVARSYTIPSGYKYMWFYVNHPTIDVANIQVELGSTATAYEPFVPNSPSPDYPSTITTTLPANTYKLPCTQPRGGYWEINIDADMHGIGTTQDIIAFDKYSGKGWASRYFVSLRISSTNSGWSVAQRNGTSAAFYANTPIFGSYPDNLLCMPLVGLCRQLQKVASVHSNDFESVSFMLQASPPYVGIRLNDSRTGLTGANTDTEVKIAFDTYLSANPIDVIVARKIPVKTPFTATWVAASTAPDLPDSVMVTNVHTPDYPVWMVGSSGSVVSEGRNLCSNMVSNGYEFAALSVQGGVKRYTYYTVLAKVKGTAGRQVGLYCDIGHATMGNARIFTGDWQVVLISGATNALSRNSTRLSLYNVPNAGYLENPAYCEWAMIVEGIYTAATIPPYQPYRPPTIATFAGDGIGDYRDTVEVWWDPATKQRKVRKTQGIKVANGISALSGVIQTGGSWLNDDSTTIAIPFSNMKSEPRRNIQCNKFIPISNQSYTSYYQVSGSWATYLYFVFKNIDVGIIPEDDSTTRKAKLVTWFADNPVDIKYPLATPIVTDITDTPEGQAYLALATFPHYTHVYSDCEVQPTITAKMKTIK